MEIISYDLKDSIKLPESIYDIIETKNYCFFDIETTGFNRYKNKIILIGIFYPTQQGSKIIHFFANNLKDEKELLINFISFISKFDFLISFNGDTFDIPFLNSRIKYNSIDYEFSKTNNIDLLKLVRKNKSILELNNCKLKTVEKKLGINRKDMISGKESVDLYYKYIKDKNNNLKNIILEHNYEDIYYLPKILDIYNLIESKSNISYLHSMKNKKIAFYADIRNINLNEEMLVIRGKSDIINIQNQIYYKDNYTFNWNSNKGLYELNINLQKGKLSTGRYCYYLDKTKYDLNIDIEDKTNYKLPKQIIIVKDNNVLINENIKSIFKSLMPQILNQLYIN